MRGSVVNWGRRGSRSECSDRNEDPVRYTDDEEKSRQKEKKGAGEVAFHIFIESQSGAFSNDVDNSVDNPVENKRLSQGQQVDGLLDAYFEKHLVAVEQLLLVCW